MRLLGAVLIILGLLLYGYSTLLEPYTNKQEYEEKYFSLSPENNSEKFFELRDAYLTAKYKLENYGFTSVVVGGFIIFFFYSGWGGFRIPRNKGAIMLIGLFAVIITVMAYMVDLFLEMSRNSYPHWGDSLGIPLAAVPVMFLFLLGWFALNLLGMRGAFKTGALVKELRFASINYWYAIILFLTLFQTLISLYEGDFGSVAAGSLWAYFFLSILVGRRAGVIEEKMKANIL